MPATNCKFPMKLGGASATAFTSRDIGTASIDTYRRAKSPVKCASRAQILADNVALSNRGISPSVLFRKFLCARRRRRRFMCDWKDD